MITQEAAAKIARDMFAKDAFSQWLGIEQLELNVGSCKLRMTVRPEMLNGFGIAHGAITYALADSALAFACNSQGRHAVSIETSISHTHAVQAGDTLIAIAEEEQLGNKVAFYRVRVLEEQTGNVVGLFKGVVYRKSSAW